MDMLIVVTLVLFALMVVAWIAVPTGKAEPKPAPSDMPGATAPASSAQ